MNSGAGIKKNGILRVSARGRQLTGLNLEIKYEPKPKKITIISNKFEPYKLNNLY